MKSTAWLTKTDGPLAAQFRFLIEADRLKTVIRANRIADDSRRENTAEHSWHLALFAMVLSEHALAPVDVWRVVQMLILHDLVEIEAGDAPLHDPQAAIGQAEREQAGADTLFGMLPPAQGAAFRAIWDEFESADSNDARFAKACDRLQPILLNHVVGGGTWTDYDVDEGRARARTSQIAHGSAVLWAAAETVFADAVAMGWLKPMPEVAA
ncbi:HD domain-containing protein [Acidisoma cladoniae]|jgi:putative hydrolase of HD superfamily|uniref:HD domain-containing protein n=1 Tax=Acidisoma cladoniae TaxID=3040935 RepID=UPI00254CDBCB|nr:HD domain-containing protein [Acidisoma sp. PAMC 29798]